MRCFRKNLLTSEEVKHFKYGQKSESDNENIADYRKAAYNKLKYEKKKHTVSFGLIEKGEFSLVFGATMTNHEKPVAVKVVDTKYKPCLLNMLNEIKVMSFAGDHENVLSLVGAYTKDMQNGIVHIITNFMKNGSLKDHLRKLGENNTPMSGSPHGLYQYCLDITKGIDYLHAKRIIHGDLATCNVLLDEFSVCKIRNFSQSRWCFYRPGKFKKKDSCPCFRKSSRVLFEDYNLAPYNKRGQWKWMAIEILERYDVSQRSDVWSLGVTFWEIFSFANEPYQNEPYYRSFEFCNRLINGLRLPKPEDAEERIYKLMMSCWELDPNDRPSPKKIIQFFQDFDGPLSTQEKI